MGSLSLLGGGRSALGKGTLLLPDLQALVAQWLVRAGVGHPLGSPTSFSAGVKRAAFASSSVSVCPFAAEVGPTPSCVMVSWVYPLTFGGK